MRDKRDRTKQITLDLTKHPKALKIYTDISINKTAWVADAIEEKHEREKGIVFTPEQIEYLNKYYIRKDDTNELGILRNRTC